MVTLHTRPPLGKVRISGSRPRLQTMMTLLTDAMEFLWFRTDYVACASSASTSSADGRAACGARMGQATTSHTSIMAAQAPNSPAQPTFLANQPPTAPPAKNPRDCSVLYTPSAAPRDCGGASREARLGWVASSTLK